MADNRTRNFATIVYPESAPDGWLDILQNEFVPCFVSPLHDKDINPEANNEEKKAHYHVMIMFEGKKSINQVFEIFNKIGGVGLITINSVRGYARYLTHMDNPEKFQYSSQDVISMCGADYLECVNLPTDKYALIKEMMQFCQINNVTSYSDLLEYAMEEQYDWFRVLCDNGSYVMEKYLKSKWWTFQRDMERRTT